MQRQPPLALWPGAFLTEFAQAITRPTPLPATTTGPTPTCWQQVSPARRQKLTAPLVTLRQRQYQLQNCAIQLGWIPTQIMVSNEDLGKSAISSGILRKSTLRIKKLN